MLRKTAIRATRPPLVLGKQLSYPFNDSLDHSSSCKVVHQFIARRVGPALGQGVKGQVVDVAADEDRLRSVAELNAPLARRECVTTSRRDVGKTEITGWIG